MDDGYKACVRCQEHKALGDFYSKGDRVDSRCKDCAKETKRKRYQEKVALKEKKNLYGSKTACGNSKDDSNEAFSIAKELSFPFECDSLENIVKDLIRRIG